MVEAACPYSLPVKLLNSVSLACYILYIQGFRDHRQTNPAKLSPFLFFLYSLVVPILTHCWLLLQSGSFSCSLKRDLLWRKRLKVRMISSLQSWQRAYIKSGRILQLNQGLVHIYCISCQVVMSHLGFTSHTDGGAGSKGVKPSQRPQHSRYCGNWARNTDGGTFSSPNYPKMYPPNKECLYVLEGNKQHALDPNNCSAPTRIFLKVKFFSLKGSQILCGF